MNDLEELVAGMTPRAREIVEAWAELPVEDGITVDWRQVQSAIGLLESIAYLDGRVNDPGPNDAAIRAEMLERYDGLDPLAREVAERDMVERNAYWADTPDGAARRAAIPPAERREREERAARRVTNWSATFPRKVPEPGQ